MRRLLQTQLSQWITPKDHRHLTVFSENIAAILQAQSGCMSVVWHRLVQLPPEQSWSWSVVEKAKVCDRKSFP